MLITNPISVIVIVLGIYLISLQHKKVTLCLIFFCHFVYMRVPWCLPSLTLLQLSIVKLFFSLLGKKILSNFSLKNRNYSLPMY